MIYCEMWLSLDKYFERSVSRFVERLYIRYEEKRRVKNE